MAEELMKNGKPRHAGLFKPGQSGNPLGRSKDSYRVSDLAKKHTEEALATLIEICTNTSAPPAARVQASVAILDRGWGKPVQQIDSNEEKVIGFLNLLQLVEMAENRYQEAITCEEVQVIATGDKLEDLI